MALSCKETTQQRRIEISESATAIPTGREKVCPSQVNANLYITWFSSFLADCILMSNARRKHTPVELSMLKEVPQSLGKALGSQEDFHL